MLITSYPLRPLLLNFSKLCSHILASRRCCCLPLYQLHFAALRASLFVCFQKSRCYKALSVCRNRHIKPCFGNLWPENTGCTRESVHSCVITEGLLNISFDFSPSAVCFSHHLNSIRHIARSCNHRRGYRCRVLCLYGNLALRLNGKIRNTSMNTALFPKGSRCWNR